MAMFRRIGLRSALPAAVFGTVFALCTGASAGQFVRVSPDLEIYYEEAGTGTPMVFIPGWTLTTEVFSETARLFRAALPDDNLRSPWTRALVYDARQQDDEDAELRGVTTVF